MSYASVAATNAPPSSQQPHADPSLLTTATPTASTVADDSAKVNVVPVDFKEHPHTITSEADVVPDEDLPHSKSAARKKKAHKKLDQAEEEGLQLWNTAKHYILRPGVAGGLIGIVNVGLIASVGRAFYTEPHLRKDAKAISATVAGALAILSAEGFAAAKYAQTPAGQAEAQRAKEEGSILYRHTREVVLRPGVLGGLVGLVNAGIMGTVGYYAYTNWDKPHWDRRTVSAVSVGLLTLWGGEGFVAERYREQHK